MAKTITLRYPGTCRDCGTKLQPGARARWYGRGRIYGTTCHPQKGKAAAAAPEDFKSLNGRCEDAPCCGCCGTAPGYGSEEPYYPEEYPY